MFILAETDFFEEVKKGCKPFQIPRTVRLTFFVAFTGLFEPKCICVWHKKWLLTLKCETCILIYSNHRKYALPWMFQPAYFFYKSIIMNTIFSLSFFCLQNMIKHPLMLKWIQMSTKWRLSKNIPHNKGLHKYSPPLKWLTSFNRGLNNCRKPEDNTTLQTNQRKHEWKSSVRSWRNWIFLGVQLNPPSGNGRNKEQILEPFLLVCCWMTTCI